MEQPHDHSHKPACSSGSSWALFGIPIAAILCCGLPVLLTAFGLTAAGAFLTANRYIILGGMVLLMGLGMFVGSRKGRMCSHGSCGACRTQTEPADTAE
ncbi:hypothetical protein [Alicyclobacillus acidiphilus]|uniref:hypothetical protein n=1 Tax=Alicyclobacillus acidiphilus TaxID=182455 RepID=UPI000831367A|nr:hypothetical protein [Alicyclobacillus acidiphilus]